MLVLALQDLLGPQRTLSPDTKHLSCLKGTGWGCHQASKLVLDNLWFLTLPATTGEYIVCKLLTSLIILSDIDTEITPRPVKDESPLPMPTGEYIVCKLLTSLIILPDIETEIAPRPVKGESPLPITTGEYIVCKLLTSLIILSDIDTEITPRPVKDESPLPMPTGEYIVCKLLTSLIILPPPRQGRESPPDAHR